MLWLFIIFIHCSLHIFCLHMALEQSAEKRFQASPDFLVLLLIGW